MPPTAILPAKVGFKRQKSGCNRQIIGFLDVGHDVGCFPQRVGGHRPQADGPIAFSGAGHADDVEFDIAAERMPLQRAADPPFDLVDGRRGFCVKLIEVHIRPLYCGQPSRGGGPASGAIVGADLVNGPLRGETAARTAPYGGSDPTGANISDKTLGPRSPRGGRNDLRRHTAARDVRIVDGGLAVRVRPARHPAADGAVVLRLLGLDRDVAAADSKRRFEVRNPIPDLRGYARATGLRAAAEGSPAAEFLLAPRRSRP